MYGGHQSDVLKTPATPFVQLVRHESRCTGASQLALAYNLSILSMASAVCVHNRQKLIRDSSMHAHVLKLI